MLLVGGAIWWAQTIVAGLVALALALQISTRRRLARISPLLVFVCVGAALTALQLIPLPEAFVAGVNPTGAELRHDGAALLGTSPWSSLSMDPPSTLRGLSYFLTLLGTAMIGLRFATSERGRFYLVSGAAAICGIAAAVTGLHALFDVTALFGLYEPQQAAPPVLGPLLNPNHLGCLMAFGTSLSVGLTFYQRQSSQLRALWLTNATGCALVAIASDSRGALISLVLGVVATLAMVVGARVTANGNDRRSRPRLSAQDLSIFLVVALALGVALYMTAGDVASEIDRTSYLDAQTPMSKFAAWRSAAELVAESPWVGVGRGGVEATLTRVHPASAYATYSHLENEYISAIVEWGVPGALLAFAALGWCIVAALRRWRDCSLSAAALGGLLGVLFQSSVDFGVQLIGLAVPATLVASTVLLVPFRDHPADTRRRGMRIALVALVAGGGLALIPSGARTIAEDHQHLASASLQEVHEIAERHPLDYLAYARAAELTRPTNMTLAVKLINHSMRLHPTHSGLHRVAARLLLLRGRSDQAALEYRIALRGTLRPQSLLQEVVRNLQTAELCSSAIPLDWEPREQIIRGMSDLGRADVAIAWLRRIVELPQTDTRIIDRLYDIASTRGDLDAAAFAALRRLVTKNTSTSLWMLAQIEYKRRDYGKVISVLADVATWRSRIDEKSQAWLLVCKAHDELGHLQDALDCLHALERSGALTSPTTHQASALRREVEYRKTMAERLHALDPGATMPVLDPAPTMKRSP